MRLALASGLISGLVCPVVGTYLIVQRMALLGDVIAHAVLPGLVVAQFFRVDMLLGAFVSGMCSTFVTAWIRTQSRVKVDSAMALTFSSFLSLGILLFTLLRSRLDLERLLFGDILGTTPTDLVQMGLITLLVLGIVTLFYKEFLFYTFDRLGAEAAGLPVRTLYVGLMALITLAIIVGMQAVGVILVITLLVGPAITAYLLVRELHQMMLLGAVLGMGSSVGGLYLSYYLNLPSGPAIALVVFSLFLLALLFSPTQGILTRPKPTPGDPSR